MTKTAIVSEKEAVALIGGGKVTKPTLERISSRISKYIAVDGGADHLLLAGIEPVAVIGDLDSLSAKSRATFSEVLHHIPEQSTTDFEKALTRVAAPVLLALGFTGGRIDHALSVLNVMARYPASRVVLVDENDASFLAKDGKTQITAPDGCRISFMPLGEAVATVTGVKWSFENQRMYPTGFTSSSNEVAGKDVELDVKGPVLVTLPQSQLAAVLQAVAHAE